MLRNLRNSLPVSMASSDMKAVQDSGSEDETFWDESKATEDHLGAAFGSASVPGAPPSPVSLTLAWQHKQRMLLCIVAQKLLTTPTNFSCLILPLLQQRHSDCQYDTTEGCSPAQVCVTAHDVSHSCSVIP